MNERIIEVKEDPRNINSSLAGEVRIEDRVGLLGGVVLHPAYKDLRSIDGGPPRVELKAIEVRGLLPRFQKRLDKAIVKAETSVRRNNASSSDYWNDPAGVYD